MADEVYKDDVNLQGLWLLEEASGTRYDDTPNANDLTDINTVGRSADSKEGSYSADFELSNAEYLIINDGDQTGLSITGNLTVVAWIKRESTPGAGFVAGKFTAVAGKRSYGLVIGSNKVHGWISSAGSGYTDAIGATSLTTATWYHVAMVYNGTDIRLYLGGSLDSNGADNPKVYSSGIYNGTSGFTIGAAGGGGNLYDGLVDEVGVFDRELTEAEVASIYNFGIQAPVVTGMPILGINGIHSAVMGGVIVR